MCLAIDEMKEESKNEQAIEIAFRMLKASKYTFDEISYISGLSLEKVLELQKEL